MEVNWYKRATRRYVFDDFHGQADYTGSSYFSKARAPGTGVNSCIVNMGLRSVKEYDDPVPISGYVYAEKPPIVGPVVEVTVEGAGTYTMKADMFCNEDTVDCIYTFGTYSNMTKKQAQDKEWIKGASTRQVKVVLTSSHPDAVERRTRRKRWK